MTLATLPFQMHVLTGPGSAMFRAVNRPKRELVYPITQLLLVLVSVSCGFLWKGKIVSVVAVAVALSMVVSAVIYIGYTNRYLCVSNGVYARRVLIPGGVPYLFGFLLAWFVQPHGVWTEVDFWPLVGLVATNGIIYFLITGCFLYRFMCDREERYELRKQAVQTCSNFIRR